MIISSLGLAGHDSELFSFLDQQYIDELERHPQANTALWTFGGSRDGALTSVCMWNTSPGCLAWTYEPAVTRGSDGFANYRGLVTSNGLLNVQALVLVRQLFSSGYTCALNDRQWISQAADRHLERLKYIRRYGCEDPGIWAALKADYFDWCLQAMEGIDP